MEQEGKTYTLEELKDILNEKQKIFCHEYVVEWNGSKSYKKAYPDAADETARVNASKLLTNTNIKQYIEYIKNDYEILCGISKIKQIREYYKLAYSNIAHLHNTWIELKDFDQLTDDQKECIESIDFKTEKKLLETVAGDVEVEVKHVKIKLYSKLAALERIDRLMGYNAVEKVDHTTKGDKMSNINLSNLTYEQLQKLAGDYKEGCEDRIS